MPKPLRVLALGDSYTIGEGVEAQHNFPNQLIQKLQLQGLKCAPPVIIAKTGWTSGELLQALRSHPPQGIFDLVFLLIGVNNQYRGCSIQEYRNDINTLTERAIEYVGGIKDSVYILSIPDYSYTPFADKLDLEKIRREIQIFNQVNKEETEKKGLNYIYITDLSTGGLEDPSLLAEDKLHPSGKMYKFWVGRIASLKYPG